MRLILEAIIVDMGARLQAQQYEPQNGYVLIGHSQGGAAVAQVSGMAIKILLLFVTPALCSYVRAVES